MAKKRRGDYFIPVFEAALEFRSLVRAALCFPPIFGSDVCFASSGVLDMSICIGETRLKSGVLLLISMDMCNGA